MDYDILGFQLGQHAMQSDAISNADYLGGAGSGAVDSAPTGRLSLSILSLAIVGVMFFYVTTHSRQF